MIYMTKFGFKKNVWLLEMSTSTAFTIVYTPYFSCSRCRVICITSARDNESMNRLEEIFLKVLNQQNTNVSGKDKYVYKRPFRKKIFLNVLYFRLLPINHCHLVIINTFPVTIESSVTNHPPKNVSVLFS